MSRVTLWSLAATLLTAGVAFAGEAEVFDVAKELAGAGQGRRAASLGLVRRPEYTVNAVVVNDEIPTHRHDDGNHVLYIVGGRGTAIVDGAPVPLKPGLLVHIPKGVSHSIKADGERLTFVDFVQHGVDPSRSEKKK